MTTAHRPTFFPAKGSSNQGGGKLYTVTHQFSSKDLPGNLTLKTRKPGQGTLKEASKINFKDELEEREENHFLHRKQERDGLLGTYYELDEDKESRKALDVARDSDDEEEDDFDNKEDVNNVFVQDKDIEFDDEDDEFDEDDDDESETRELWKEYERIRKIREEEKKEEERRLAEKMKSQNREEVLMGNPLLNKGSHMGYSLKKKWFEDTVFKNQAKTEHKVKKRFINDTVRSDFHRKFISKCVQ